MKCSCKENIIQKSDDGTLRFRIDGPMTMTPDGILKAKCHWCSKVVELPLELKKGAIETRFFIKADASSG
jgi:hypothetical protein